jgi:outer membrane protein assembly factor BamE (lipoprotein component of BamABCDE complex)
VSWRLALLAPLLLCSGCYFLSRSSGSKTFLAHKEEVAWERGKTTTLDVAQALGAPDMIERWQNELWFVYRYTEDRLARLAFKMVVTVFERREEHQVDTRLIVAFDPEDKLLYHATVEGEGGLLAPR